MTVEARRAAEHGAAPHGAAGHGAAPHEADELLLGFARALRAAGLAVTSDRAQSFLQAAARVGVDDHRTTYWAGRATLCSGPDDLARYDQVFHAWFLARERRGQAQQAPEQVLPQAALGLDQDPGRGTQETSGAGEGEDEEQLIAAASATEVLRHRDIAAMDPREKARLAALFATLRPRAPRRTASRWGPAHRGDVDASRTLRLMRRRMGEPGTIAWRRRRDRARRVVLLIDVSGSMSPYADALLRLGHTFAHTRPRAGLTARPRDVELFTLGTRLTHITRAMRLRDPEQAIIAAGRTVPDWSGGTRLGETLKVFLDRWGQRGTARGAVVVLISDGWERGDPALLAEQMRRLHLLAHRVVWMNPHRGKTGYEPVQQGIVAALPFVDDFVAGHSLAAFADLVEVVGDA
jgi:uncharacterized protein with von Willebrand factor type A (vWA) domain